MPVKRKAKVDPVPEEFATVEAAAEFWDQHDATDYLEHTRAVEDVVVAIKRRGYLVALEPALARELSQAARQRGISTEALVNLWLQEKLRTADGKPRKG